VLNVHVILLSGTTTFAVERGFFVFFQSQKMKASKLLRSLGEKMSSISRLVFSAAELASR